MSLKRIAPSNKFTFARAAACFCCVLVLTLMVACATRPTQEVERADEEPLAGVGSLGPATGITGTEWAAMCVTTSAQDSKPEDLNWEIFRVPGKEPTRYSYTQQDGRAAVLALADASGSILRHRQRVEAAELGRIHFSWMVPLAESGINQSLSKLEDVPVRIVLAFEGDRSKFSFKNTLLNELSLLLTGEEMPFATLVYAWSRVNKPGEVVLNDRTDRIRKLIVDSGDQGYNQWKSYERDVRADYRKAFGEEPGALLSFAVFTEGERDEGQLQAWYGPVKHQPLVISRLK